MFLNADGNNITWYAGNFERQLVDERDGRTYRTVAIGTQIWMAENLNIEPPSRVRRKPATTGSSRNTDTTTIPTGAQPSGVCTIRK
ncbi:MAG: FISUMP domain-containing protein [Bacteroidales bacterium]